MGGVGRGVRRWLERKKETPTGGVSPRWVYIETMPWMDCAFPTFLSPLPFTLSPLEPRGRSEPQQRPGWPSAARRDVIPTGEPLSSRSLNFSLPCKTWLYSCCGKIWIDNSSSASRRHPHPPPPNSTRHWSNLWLKKLDLTELQRTDSGTIQFTINTFLEMYVLNSNSGLLRVLTYFHCPLCLFICLFLKEFTSFLFAVVYRTQSRG